MKHFSLLSLTCILVSSVCAETVFTIPQGYTRITIPAAASSSSPTLTSVSINLFNNLTYSGTAVISADFDPDPDSDTDTTDTAQTVTSAGATWTADEWIATPHLAHIVNANGAEESFLIVGNTTDTLTLDGGFDLLADSRFNSATTVKIREANTIGSVLGTDNTPFTQNDLVYVWDGSAWESFVTFGGDWFAASGSNAGDDVTDAVIFPEEGLFIQRNETTDATLTFFGEVPTLSRAATVVGESASFISTSFPVGDTEEGATLASLNINSIPGWSTDDSVFVWSGSEWIGFVEFSGNWFFSTGSNAGNDANTYIVDANSAVFLSRSSSGSASNSGVTIPVPYTLDPVE